MNKIERRFLVREMVGPTDLRQKRYNASTLQANSLLREAKGKIVSYLRDVKKELPYVLEDQSIIQMDEEFQKQIQENPDGFEEFLKKLVSQKVSITGQKKKIETFSNSIQEMKTILQFPDWIEQGSENKFIISNIFQSEDFKYNPASSQLLTLQKMIKSRNFNNKARQETTLYSLLNTTFYHQINLALPSIGHLYLPTSMFEDHTSITEAFLQICNGAPNVVNFLPLHKRHHLKEDLTKLILKKGTKNEDFKKRLLESVFQNIEITYDMVMKEGTSFKKEFILPYQVMHASTEEGKTEIKYDRVGLLFTSAKDILEQNRRKMIEVWKLFRENPNITNGKEVLGLYVYISIQLFYEIYQLYFKKISDVLYEYNEDPRFQEDQIPLGIAYIDKCIQSLMNFKKILLNNYFDYFLPSKISKAYGIRRDEYGYIIASSRYVVDENFLTNNYIYRFFNESNQFEISRDSLMAVNHFLVGKRRTHDLYDENDQLCIGFYLPNQKKMDDLLQFYSYYLEVLKIQFSFQIFLYQTMSRILLHKVPIELLASFQKKLDAMGEENISSGSSSMSASSTKKIQAILLEYYKMMNKSFKKLKMVKEKIAEKANYGKSGRELREKEEALLIANHSYIMAECMREMVTHHIQLPKRVKKELQDKIRLIQRRFDMIQL